MRRTNTSGGRALDGLGGLTDLTKPNQTPNTREYYLGRHTAGANVRREEGNNPDLPAKVPKSWLSGKAMWDRQNNQEVGLEAAIL